MKRNDDFGKFLVAFRRGFLLIIIYIEQKMRLNPNNKHFEFQLIVRRGILIPVRWIEKHLGLKPHKKDEDST